MRRHHVRHQEAGTQQRLQTRKPGHSQEQVSQLQKVLPTGNKGEMGIFYTHRSNEVEGWWPPELSSLINAPEPAVGFPQVLGGVWRHRRTLSSHHPQSGVPGGICIEKWLLNSKLTSLSTGRRPWAKLVIGRTLWAGKPENLPQVRWEFREMLYREYSFKGTKNHTNVTIPFITLSLWETESFGSQRCSIYLHIYTVI